MSSYLNVVIEKQIVSLFRYLYSKIRLYVGYECSV